MLIILNPIVNTIVSVMAWRAMLDAPDVSLGTTCFITVWTCFNVISAVAVFTPRSK